MNITKASYLKSSLLRLKTKSRDGLCFFANVLEIWYNSVKKRGIKMLTSEKKKREQIQVLCIDDLVPEEHLLRKIENAIDWSFIYELVEDKYSKDKGRPSILN